jgi:hypothetical protein
VEEIPKPNNDEQSKSWWQKWLLALGKLRDGLLLLAGGIYLLGYLSWATFAGNRHLGFVPVVDAQYFAAGIFPTVILFMTCLIIWSLQQFARKSPRPGSAARQHISEKFERVSIISGGFFAITVFLSKIVFRLSPNSDYAPTAAALVCVSLMVASLSALISTFLGTKDEDIKERRSYLNYSSIIIVFIAIAMFVTYATEFFQYVPQSFGGPSLEPVQLDVNVSNLSSNSLMVIAPAQKTATNGVVRSQTLYLVLQNGGYILLQTNSDWSQGSQIFKIKNETVQGIFPVIK